MASKLIINDTVIECERKDLVTAEIQKAIYNFRVKYSVEPNALILGVDVMHDLMIKTNIVKSVRDERIYVYGYEVIDIDYANPIAIKAVLT